jgi:hypothetical protein
MNRLPSLANSGRRSLAAPEELRNQSVTVEGAFTLPRSWPLVLYVALVISNPLPPSTARFRVDGHADWFSFVKYEVRLMKDASITDAVTNTSCSRLVYLSEPAFGGSLVSRGTWL